MTHSSAALGGRILGLRLARASAARPGASGRGPAASLAPVGVRIVEVVLVGLWVSLLACLHLLYCYLVVEPLLGMEEGV